MRPFVLGRLESQGLKTNFLIILVTDFNLCTWSFLTQGGLTATFKAEYMGSQTSPLPAPAYSEAPPTFRSPVSLVFHLPGLQPPRPELFSLNT